MEGGKAAFEIVKCQHIYDGTMQPGGSAVFQRIGYAPLREYREDSAEMRELLDKYAKLLVKHPSNYDNRGKYQRFEASQPLGMHHSRAYALPMAVGPASIAGINVFQVGSNTGCSSLLNVSLSSPWAAWCRRVSERREVVSITLERALGWIGRPIDFLKIVRALPRIASCRARAHVAC